MDKVFGHLVRDYETGEIVDPCLLLHDIADEF